MNRFYENLKQIAVLFKLFCVVLVFGVAVGAIIAPSFLLGQYVHWSLGVIYGVVAFVLITTLATTLLERTGKERTVWDWIEKPFGKTRP